MTEVPTTPDPKAELTRIGREIDKLREGVHQTMAAAAVEIGKRLIEAKAICPHGKWLSWLAAHGVHERGAERAMALAHYVAAEEASANPTRVSDLLQVSYREALRVVQAARTAKRAGSPGKTKKPTRATAPQPLTMTQLETELRQKFGAEAADQLQAKVEAALAAAEPPADADELPTQPAIEPETMEADDTDLAARKPLTVAMTVHHHEKVLSVPLYARDPEAEPADAAGSRTEPKAAEELLLPDLADPAVIAKRLWDDYGIDTCRAIFETLGSWLEAAASAAGEDLPTRASRSRPESRVRNETVH